jgi:hypothetical protein
MNAIERDRFISCLLGIEVQGSRVDYPPVCGRFTSAGKNFLKPRFVSGSRWADIHGSNVGEN